MPFSAPYAGLRQVIRPDGNYRANMRFGLLRVTIQALVWRSGDRYLPLRDDIASVAYWYQTQPHNPFPPLPDKDSLEVK